MSSQLHCFFSLSSSSVSSVFLLSLFLFLCFSPVYLTFPLLPLPWWLQCCSCCSEASTYFSFVLSSSDQFHVFSTLFLLCCLFFLSLCLFLYFSVSLFYSFLFLSISLHSICFLFVFSFLLSFSSLFGLSSLLRSLYLSLNQVSCCFLFADLFVFL